MRAALQVEWLKLRRSRVTLVATAFMGLLVPAIGLAFYSVAMSGGVGAIAVKAAAFLIGEGWVGYLGLVDQIAAVAVFGGAGVVVAWGFGREHVDRTFPSLFALTVPRATIALAKFLVLSVWIVALALVIVLVALILGIVAQVGPVEIDAAAGDIVRLFLITTAAGALALTMGYAASLGRGYLPAIGALMVVIVAAQVAVLFGAGGWFPFAVPGLMAVEGAEGAPNLSPAQFALVPAMSLVSIWMTTRWWARAEVV
ncbi:MAG: ABC transporter permease [Acidimicrobiia bacterium]